MPPIRAILVLIAAITISFFAAYMSVVGMYALFPAAGWVIIGSMIGVEFAKLVAAETVHAEWSTGLLNRAKKFYLCTAIGALMAITAMGVYGFLAKGHLEQAAPIAPVQLEIAQKEARQQQIREELTRLTTQQNQINSTVDNMVTNSTTARDARAGLRARQGMAAERKEVQAKIDKSNEEMNRLNQELVPLKMKVAAVETKLGPLQYVADLFGWEDPEAAVRLIILLLMIAFDPLAIVLMIVGTNIWARWLRGRKATPLGGSLPSHPEPETKVELKPNAVPEPEPEPKSPVSDIDPEQPPLDPVTKSYVNHSDWTWPIEPDHRPLDDFEVPPPVVPSPKPSSWGYVPDMEPLVLRLDQRIEPKEEIEEPGSLLPELEGILEAKKQTDAEALVELVEQNPELADEVAEILAENPDLLDEVQKAVEKPTVEWWPSKPKEEK